MATALQSRHKLDLAAPEFVQARRDLSFDFDRASPGAINEAERTVEFSFASAQPVERWFGNEILDITSDACDLSRLNNAGACLVNHDWTDQVGAVTKAWLDPKDGKARCAVKFSRGARGQEIFDDIKDGIRRLVSVGYIVRKMELVSVERDVETHRVTDWQPYEVSVVAVPADTSVGVGRAQPTPEDSVKPINSPRIMSATTTTTPEVPAVEKVVDLAGERQRIKDLNAAAAAIGARHPQHAETLRALAAKCSESGDSLDSFNRTVLNDVLSTKRDLAPVTQNPNAGSVGLKAKDVKRYSVMRAIQCVMNNQPLDGLEGECNAELTRKLDRQPKGFFLPDEIASDRRSVRANTVSTPADGGYLVGEQQLTGELVTFLRNNAVVAKLGARVIGGLQGDVTIPRQLTGAAAYWVSESGSITQSSATFGQIVGRPRRIGTSVPYSKQFLAQASIDAESFIVADSDASIALDIDRVCLRGTGGVEPLGIANLATGDRSTSVTFGAAPTWAKYLEFFSSVAGSNALLGTPAYVASVASAVKAMSVAKFSNTGMPIWDNNKVGVFNAEWTTQLLTTSTPVANMVIFGDFSQVCLLEWAGRDVVIDPYTGKKEGTVEVTIQRLMDVVIRRGKSFAISADSGAQS